MLPLGFSARSCQADVVQLPQQIERNGFGLDVVALLIKEGGADVPKAYSLHAFEQIRQVGIELNDLLAVGMIEIAPSRQHAKHQDVNIGINLFQFPANRLNAFGGLRILDDCPVRSAISQSLGRRL